MKSKIFVSCGQRPEEKEIATKISQMLNDRGFSPYVAIDVQTIFDINGGIIRELKDSDCYLFINFRRDWIGTEYRGSLFSNQELAIAYALGFERFLVINQDGVRREGMLAYIGINTETFVALDDCPAAVERALDRAKWTPEYSRRLEVGNLRFSDVIGYGNLAGRFIYADVKNGRPDIAAIETTARLAEFCEAGEPWQACPIRSPLKATGRPGFAQTIFPQSHEAFDILCIGAYIPSLWAVPSASGSVEVPIICDGVYLNSALDVTPLPKLAITFGVWMLRYEFLAIGFPLLSASIEFTFESWNKWSAKLIEQTTM